MDVLKDMHALVQMSEEKDADERSHARSVQEYDKLALTIILVVFTDY